jgi:hypothetical protein
MSRPLVAFGDVEQTVLDYLRPIVVDEYPDAVLGTKYPGDPVVFVLVRRVGGASAGVAIDLATVDVQCWHRTEVESHDLAAFVRAHLQRLRGVGQIRSVRESAAPVSVPDPDTGRARYLQTVDLTLKGATL